MHHKNQYEGREFELKLPNIDHIIQQILNTNNAKLIKVDISRAFRNIMVDPRDAIKCGIQHENQYYIDKALVFGAINGTKIFERVSDVIVHIMSTKYVQIFNYIDDIFLACESDIAREVFTTLVNLVTELGLPINQDKLTAPTDKMIVMGIEIDI